MSNKQVDVLIEGRQRCHYPKKIEDELYAKGERQPTRGKGGVNKNRGYGKQTLVGQGLM